MRVDAARLCSNFYFLCVIQATSFRWAWRSLFLTGLILPSLSLYGISILLSGSPGSIQPEYLLTANILMASLMPLIANTSSRVCFLGLTGAREYFELLPVPPWLCRLSIVTVFFLLSLPGVLLAVGVNTIHFGLPLKADWGILLVVPSAALAFGSLGLVIGAHARTPDHANAMSHLTSAVLLTAAPVFVSIDRLPWGVRYMRLVMPSDYAARALRATLVSTSAGTETVWVDVVALVLFAFAGFLLAGHLASAER